MHLLSVIFFMRHFPVILHVQYFWYKMTMHASLPKTAYSIAKPRTIARATYTYPVRCGLYEVLGALHLQRRAPIAVFGS